MMNPFTKLCKSLTAVSLWPSIMELDDDTRRITVSVEECACRGRSLRR